MSNKFSDYFLYALCGNTGINPPSLPCCNVNLVCMYEISSQLVLCNHGFRANTKYLKVVRADFCRTWKLIRKLSNELS